MRNFFWSAAVLSRRNVLWLVLTLAALCLAPSLAAASPPVVTPVVTGNPSADATVAQLSQINSANDYGQTIINWIAYGAPDGESSTPSLLSHVAKQLSMISLFMMAALAAFGGMNYVIHTANKGMPGGQIISSFWMPIRISVATILLVPVPGGTGYSTLHHGVIKIAEMGSAHAGWVMNQTLDFIDANGVYKPPTIKTGDVVANTLVASELCMLYVNTTEQSDSVYTDTHKGAIRYNKRGTLSSLYVDRKKFCGGLGFAFSDSSDPDLMDTVSNPMSSTPTYNSSYKDYSWTEKTQLDALDFANNTLRPAARRVAQALLADQAAMGSIIKNPNKNSQEFKNAQTQTQNSIDKIGPDINAIANLYNEWVTAKATEVSTHFSSSAGTGGKSISDEIKEAGWPAFGMIFWHTMQQQKKINQVMNSLLPMPDYPTIAAHGYSEDERWSILIGRLSETQQAASERTDAPPSLMSLVSAGNFEGAGSEGVSKTAKKLLANTFAYVVIPNSEDANIVTRLQSTGMVMLNTTELFIWAKIIADAKITLLQETATGLVEAAEAGANAVPKIVGGGFIGAAGKAAAAPVKGAIAGIGKLLTSILQYFSFLLLPVLFAGFLLGIVLPTIPAMFWLLGVISYMLFFVQCLLVSTFWLAAHGTAEGQGWGSEHTRQGYLLMVGLYLSPVLRVAGFAAMLIVLMPVGVLAQWMLNYVFGYISWLSPLSILSAMVITAIFAYSACVRIFALPSELFEDGLRWINGGKEVTGDSGAEHQSRMMIATFTRNMGGGEEGKRQPGNNLIPGGGGINPADAAQAAIPGAPKH